VFVGKALSNLELRTEESVHSLLSHFCFHSAGAPVWKDETSVGRSTAHTLPTDYWKGKNYKRPEVRRSAGGTLQN